MAEVWELVTVIVGTVTPLTGIIIWLNTQREKSLDRLEKELCKLRENMTEMVTEILDKYEKHEEQDRRYFNEIFNTLAEMRGRESARGKSAV